MSEVHQNPAGSVWVRTPTVTYGDTLANFERDFGVTLPPLPEGADDHVYTQGIRHAFHNSTTGNLIAGGEMPWPLGDEVIANIDLGLAAKAARADVSATEFDMGGSMKMVITGGL